MYSTFSATADADSIGESSILFGQDHDDLLSLEMSRENAHLKAPAPSTVPLSSLNNLVYGQYNESTPSSTQFGDAHDLSEPGGSHIGGRNARDGSASSGYGNGQDSSHAPSPLHYSQGFGSNPTNGSSLAADSKLSLKTNGVHSKSPTVATTFSTGAPPAYRQGFEMAVTEALKPTNDTRNQTAKLSSTPETSMSHDHDKSHRPSSSSTVKGKTAELRANSSIPTEMSWEEFARQCVLAAESSRLNPFALHPGEYELLREHITRPQVTIYLNIRNAILRLWTRNPLVHVSMEEAAGCARERRFFALAKVAHLWLLRNGYINYGCVEIPKSAGPIPRAKAKAAPKPSVIVIGAGMSGLGCARHLEALFAQLGEQWTDAGMRPPTVTVLEARPRVGGRVYSHPFLRQANSSLPTGHRCTAEMGAQIITGFERGNPLNTLVRGQLGLPYHGLRDNTILYDHDGSIVEKERDTLVEELYNDVLERASVYRNKPATFQTVEGDRNLILFGREPSDVGGPTISALEDSNSTLPAHAKATASTTKEKPSSGVEKLAGRAYQLSAWFRPDISAAEVATKMGWHLRPGVSSTQSLDLDTIAKASTHPTLGQTMDEGFQQYQAMLNMEPKDLRLLNWHHANLEYANAASVNQLSLSGWDQDIGNEWEGEHTEIIGGYQQVPRGLWQCPSKLDVHFSTVVKSIRYSTEQDNSTKAVRVECTNGAVFEADKVVITTPLGVLKAGSVRFEPELPDWKRGVIERMGFGLLNKVILVYEDAFWEAHRDMFGLLNEAEHHASLNQVDYASRRGRFYLFWNCIKTSGRPTLVALLAGDAAHYAEASSDNELIQEVTGRLKKMFAPKVVPLPVETIVTRWSKDPFARGSYSYVGPRTQAGDYDVMARPHGPLHFAGEATCGTHPATVHGAYLSGLRVAAEVVESMVGPIQVPTPLVEKRVKAEHQIPWPNSHLLAESPLSMAAPATKHKLDLESVSRGSPRQRQVDEEYEASIIGAILAQIGERPLKPGRAGVNPFLLYTKDMWHVCKKDCDDARRAATGNPDAKASRTEIRTALGLKWRTDSAEAKKPYLDQTQQAKDAAAANAASFKDRVAAWDRDAARIRQEYIAKNSPPSGIEAMVHSKTAIEMGGAKRLRRTA